MDFGTTVDWLRLVGTALVLIAEVLAVRGHY